jgi:hypothetical protein
VSTRAAPAGREFEPPEARLKPAPARVSYQAMNPNLRQANAEPHAGSRCLHSGRYTEFASGRARMLTKLLTRCLLGLAILIAATAALADVMRSFDHNEHMYISASVLVSQGRVLYEDFAYLQMPYLPLLYSAVYKTLGITSYYLLAAKVVSFLFLATSALILFLLARSVTRDATLSLGVAALFLLNTTILRAGIEASNYIMPVAFSIAAFYVFHLSVSTPGARPLPAALAGLLLALAIGAKLTYASTVVPFLAVSLWLALKKDRSADTGRSAARVLVPFLTGLAIGLLPALFYLASDPGSFFFDNLGFHNLTSQWRRETGCKGPISLGGKIKYAYIMYRKPDNVILMLGVVFGLVRPRRRLAAGGRMVARMAASAAVAALLVVVGAATALAPTPSFPQYYAMPVSLLFLLLVYLYRSHTPERWGLCRAAMTILVLVTAIYRIPPMLDSIQIMGTKAGWRGVRVHDLSVRLRQALIDHGVGVDDKIATLSPVVCIEAGLPIYAELCTGPFLYRVGDLLTPQQRQRFVGTSPGSIAGLFQADPPGAVLVGSEGDLDKPLIEYATANDYKMVKIAGLTGKLYVRP